MRRKKSGGGQLTPSAINDIGRFLKDMYTRILTLRDDNYASVIGQGKTPADLIKSMNRFMSEKKEIPDSKQGSISPKMNYIHNTMKDIIRRIFEKISNGTYVIAESKIGLHPSEIVFDVVKRYRSDINGVMDVDEEEEPPPPPPPRQAPPSPPSPPPPPPPPQRHSVCKGNPSLVYAEHAAEILRKSTCFEFKKCMGVENRKQFLEWSRRNHPDKYRGEFPDGAKQLTQRMNNCMNGGRTTKKRRGKTHRKTRRI